MIEEGLALTRFFIGTLFFISVNATALPSLSALHKKVFKTTECVSNGEAAMVLTGAAAGGITGACAGLIGGGLATASGLYWLFAPDEPSSMTHGEGAVMMVALGFGVYAVVGGASVGGGAGFVAGAATGGLAGSACYRAFVKPFIRDKGIKDSPRLPET